MFRESRKDFSINFEAFAVQNNELLLIPNLREYNNVHFEGVTFICGPHLAIIGPSEARADLMAR